MNDQIIREWLSKRFAEFQATLQSDLSGLLANLRTDYDSAIAKVKEIDAALQAEGNARRGAEEDARQVRLKFDPDIKAEEKAKLRKRKEELAAEIASIDASIK